MCSECAPRTRRKGREEAPAPWQSLPAVPVSAARQGGEAGRAELVLVDALDGGVVEARGEVQVAGGIDGRAALAEAAELVLRDGLEGGVLLARGDVGVAGVVEGRAALAEQVRAGRAVLELVGALEGGVAGARG